MRVAVFASSKGGVGKSTLTAAMAVEAARNGNKVGIFDFDPIQNVARWFDARTRNASDNQLTLIDRITTVDEAGEQARRLKLDWLMIDTPPASLRRIQSAVELADLVVLPLRPSPLDATGMGMIFELCDLSRRRRLLVLNGTNAGSAMTIGARHYLQSHAADLWDGEISSRELHALAMMSGSTAAEFDPASPAVDEIRKLWNSIDNMTRAAVRNERRRKAKLSGRT